MTSIQIDINDGLSSSTAIKGPCRVATTANITLVGEQTIDGVAVVTGNRVLVKNQTIASDNGIYVVDTGNWRRAKDFNKSRDVRSGTKIVVASGSTNSGDWMVSTSDPINVGTTNISFVRTPIFNGVVSLFGAIWASALAVASYAEAWIVLKLNGSLSTRALIKALTPQAGMSVLLTESGRVGNFVWTLGDFSTQVAADTQEGMYLKATSVAATVGAWVRADNDDAFNVRKFGALVDNSANDTAAITGAISLASALGGGRVYVPGISRVTSLGNLPANVELLGAGRAKSKLRTTSATLDVVTVDGANAHIHDIGFDATVTRSAGNFINVTTNASTFDLHRINMIGAFRGVSIPSVALANLSHIDILDTVPSTGVSIVVTGGFAIVFNNVICRASGGTRPFAHLNINHVEDIMVSDSQFIGAQSNLNLIPASGQYIGLYKSVNTQYDDATGPSIRIVPTGTGMVNEVVIDAPWIKGTLQDVLISNAGGGTVNTVDIMNAMMTGTGNGVEATGVGNIGVFNCKIGGHTTAIALTDVAKGRICGNVLAAHGIYAVNTTGLYMAGTTDGVLVDDNNLTSTTPVSYSASGTKNRLVNNNGYNDTGGMSAITVGASPATIAAKPYPRTMYLNGGTVSLVTVNGTNTLQSTNHAIYLAPNHTLSITYSVLPTLIEAIG